MRKWLLILLAMLPALSEAATITYSRTDFPSGRPPERIMAPRASDNDTFEEVLSSSNSLQTTPGTLVPCEIVGINRCAVVNHDDCTVISAAGTTNALKTGSGSFARINYMSGTAVSVKLYDALTVTGTAFYDNSAIGVTPSTGFLPPTVHIGRALSTGLTVVVAGTNPMVQLCYL